MFSCCRNDIDIGEKEQLVETKLGSKRIERTGACIFTCCTDDVVTDVNPDLPEGCCGGHCYNCCQNCRCRRIQETDNDRKASVCCLRRIICTNCFPCCYSAFPACCCCCRTWKVVELNVIETSNEIIIDQSDTSHVVANEMSDSAGKTEKDSHNEQDITTQESQEKNLDNMSVGQSYRKNNSNERGHESAVTFKIDQKDHVIPEREALKKSAVVAEHAKKDQGGMRKSPRLDTVRVSLAIHPESIQGELVEPAAPLSKELELGDGAYLVFNQDDDGSIFIRWSQTALKGKGILAYAAPQKPVGAFNYTNMNGKVLLQNNLKKLILSKFPSDQIKYVTAWGTFLKSIYPSRPKMILMPASQAVPPPSITIMYGTGEHETAKILLYGSMLNFNDICGIAVFQVAPTDNVSWSQLRSITERHGGVLHDFLK